MVDRSVGRHWGRTPGTVERARRWFAEPALRTVSTRHDDRETAGSRRLALELALASLEAPPGLVLDVGCGDGATLAWAAVACPQARLVGIDPAPQAVDAARDVLRPYGHRAEVVERTAERLFDPPAAVEAGSVGLALVHLCLGLWDDARTGLDAVVASLAPGGVAYVVDLLRPDHVEDADAFVDRADGDEREYLLDQLAASFSTTEVERLRTDLVRPGVRTTVGVGGLGGHAFGSAVAGRLWAAPGVRRALDAMGEFTAAEAAKAAHVWHLWIVREPGS